MKVLFLDIDGVLNWEKTTHKVDGWRGLCDIRIERLNKIFLAVPEVQVVLSSSWRDMIGLYQTRGELLKRGYKGPDFHSATISSAVINERGGEIKDWFFRHDMKVEEFAKRENPPRWAPKPVTNFVILDDDREGFEGGRWSAMDLTPYHVQTLDFHNGEEEGGLQDHHIEKVIQILLDEDLSLV